MDVFRTPDDRFADLPGWDFPPNYLEVDGLRIHHVDVAPDGPPTVVRSCCSTVSRRGRICTAA